MAKDIQYLVQQYTNAETALDMISTIYGNPWPGDPMWEEYKETLIDTLSEFDITYDEYDRVLMYLVCNTDIK